ncbi:hypothetical protein ColKHC_02638 [Colletotrichum higginsianum]|nr:hypothetical protein ColKHC_02638 [Colletotrichum higginsianum]
MPLFNTLPGAEAVVPRPRPGSLSSRFREHGTGAISLLKELLKLDWRSRINAGDALNHPYFKMAPMPAEPGDLPTFEDSHELDRRKFHDRQAKLPPAPKGGTVGMGPEAHGANAGFNNADAYNNRNGVNGTRHPNMPGGHRNGDERRPAWQRDRGLPPRPPPPEYVNGGPLDRDAFRDRDRDRRPRSRGGTKPLDIGKNVLRATVVATVEMNDGMTETGIAEREAAVAHRSEIASEIGTCTADEITFLITGY